MVVVIPAYEPNEELENLVSELDCMDYRIVIVNDGSSPDKNIIFEKLKDKAVILHHTVNYGKGRAIKTALHYISEYMPEESGVVTVDADGQHRPDDIEAVCRSLRYHNESLILGVRKFEGKVPFRSRFGNAVTRAVFALASGKKLWDTQTGLRAFRTEWIPFMLNVKGDRYEYEMNMLLSCAECGIDWVEVPIRTVYLNDRNTSSHFHPFKDSLRIYQSILKFSGSSFISFVLDYILFNIFTIFLEILSFENSVFFSNILARVISCGFNYHLNKKYVFRSYGSHMKVLKYFTLAFGILAANTVLLQILTTIGIPAFAAKIMTESILFIGSMLIQRFLIFKPEKNNTSYQRSKETHHADNYKY